MPEGPEIRLAADRIAHALSGRRIEAVLLEPRRLQRFQSLLEGAEVLGVETRGKAMLTRFDNGLTLYSHNQLYGRWYVTPRGELPRTARSLRVALHTASRSALLYSATDVDILDDAQLEAHPFLRRIGPDLLDPALTWQVLAARLVESRFKGRSLAGLYLDQAFVAGIGNYLRSEALHFAGLAHTRRPAQMSRTERQRLARHTLAVARRSYLSHGITNTPARVRTRKAAGDTTRGAYRFAVFARAGQPCDVCGSTVQRAEAAARRIYFCPQCQR